MELIKNSTKELCPVLRTLIASKIINRFVKLRNYSKNSSDGVLEALGLVRLSMAL